MKEVLQTVPHQETEIKINSPSQPLSTMKYLTKFCQVKVCCDRQRGRNANVFLSKASPSGQD